jgi:hypothetical protein
MTTASTGSTLKLAIDSAIPRKAGRRTKLPSSSLKETSKAKKKRKERKFMC